MLDPDQNLSGGLASAVSDAVPDEMEEHLKGLGYIEQTLGEENPRAHGHVVA